MENNKNIDHKLEDVFAVFGEFSIAIKAIQVASEEQNRSLKEELKTIVNDAQNTIRQETKQAISEALISQTEEFEKRLKFTMNDIDDSFKKMNQERKAIAIQTKLLTWKGIIGLAVGMSIVVIASLSLSWDAKKKRDEALEELDRIVKTQKITGAEQMFIKTMCGESVCIKIDPKAPRWGENKEYVIPLLNVND